MSRVRWAGLLGIALLLSGPAHARLLARVEPGWSPFLRGEVVQELSSLVSEARALLASDPGRVAEILGRVPLPPGPGGTQLRGLRADALYQVGGSALTEALRLYRALEAEAGDPAEVAWVRFMLGNLHRGLGFDREAEAWYREALRGPEGPWAPALRFDAAVLHLESGRWAEGRDTLLWWLDRHGAEPGRAIVLYLLGEAEAALGDDDAARQRFREAQEHSPNAWLVRPETGHALAALLRREGRLAEAADVLERLAADRAGTDAGGQALLSVGELWESQGDVLRAARAYAGLLGGGTTPAVAREGVLRLALLGAEHSGRVELAELVPAHRVFHRPGPTLEEVAAGRDPLAAQRALGGLAILLQREGQVEAALGLLIRAFRDYPESPESGRAYESFIALLEGYLDERAQAGAHADVVVVYAALREAIAWVPTRETGSLTLRAAQAYERLGTPALAKPLYEDLLSRGTRAISAEELSARLLRARAAEGDAEARLALVEAQRDWRTLRTLARTLAAAGDLERARQTYLEALGVAPGADERVGLLAEADALFAPRAATPELLEALLQRRALWQTLPAGAERQGWDAHGRLVEARLRYASGDGQTAARLLRSLPELAPEDRYLLALAERAAGNLVGADAALRGLVEEGSPPFSGLARVHLELSGSWEGVGGDP
ncbi:MAG: tetratricopeptide repeat protein [Deferrisomatales bacterium]